MTKLKNPLADEFLPKGYELPDSSSFMKFTPGKHKFRILSSLVTGYEYWKTVNGKDVPVRSRVPFTETPDIKVDENGKSNVSHFWNLTVWDYATESIKSLTITQKGLQKYILERLNDPEWGNPNGYDLVVTREGSGKFDTKYAIAANPHKEVSAEIKDAYEKANINLESVFEEKE